MSQFIKPHTLEGWEHLSRQQTEQIIAYASQNAKLREALEALVEMCVLHVGRDYSDHVHSCWEKGKAALALIDPTEAAMRGITAQEEK